MTPEQDTILRRVENELLGPSGPQGEILGWATDLGPRTLVAMLVDLVNGLIAQQPQAQQPQAQQPQAQQAQSQQPQSQQVQQPGPQQAGQNQPQTPQQVPRSADPQSIKTAFAALPPAQAAPLLAELVQIQQTRQLTPEQHARALGQTQN